ncbi:hypothetical protein ACLX1H_008266 [Fusarium chlamydosporum]
MDRENEAEDEAISEYVLDSITDDDGVLRAAFMSRDIYHHEGIQHGVKGTPEIVNGNRPPADLVFADTEFMLPGKQASYGIAAVERLSGNPPINIPLRSTKTDKDFERDKGHRSGI